MGNYCTNCADSKTESEIINEDFTSGRDEPIVFPNNMAVV